MGKDRNTIIGQIVASKLKAASTDSKAEKESAENLVKRLTQKYNITEAEIQKAMDSDKPKAKAFNMEDMFRGGGFRYQSSQSGRSYGKYAGFNPFTASVDWDEIEDILGFKFSDAFKEPRAKEENVQTDSLEFLLRREESREKEQWAKDNPEFEKPPGWGLSCNCMGCREDRYVQENNRINPSIDWEARWKIEEDQWNHKRKDYTLYKEATKAKKPEPRDWESIDDFLKQRYGFNEDKAREEKERKERARRTNNQGALADKYRRLTQLPIIRLAMAGAITEIREIHEAVSIMNKADMYPDCIVGATLRMCKKQSFNITLGDLKPL